MIAVSTAVGSPDALGTALDVFIGSAVSDAVCDANIESVAASDITDCDAVRDAAETVGNDDSVAQYEGLTSLETLEVGDQVSVEFPDVDTLHDGDHVKVEKSDPDTLSVGNRVGVVFVDAETLSVEITVLLNAAEKLEDPAGVDVWDCEAVAVETTVGEEDTVGSTVPGAVPTDVSERVAAAEPEILPSGDALDVGCNDMDAITVASDEAEALPAEDMVNVALTAPEKLSSEVALCEGCGVVEMLGDWMTELDTVPV